MALKVILYNVSLKLRFKKIGVRCYCTGKSDNILESAEEKPRYSEDEIIDTFEIEKKRNKSRLSEEHRNILFDQKPYDRPIEPFHNTVKYKKRILGRYGMHALGVPAGLAWPTPEQVEDSKEYESLLYSPDIQDRLRKIIEEKKEKEEAIIARQNQIAAKMVNMQKLIAEVQEKIAQKKQKELKAQLRKEEKIQEIRRSLIAKGGITKEKFKEALTVTEKDEKKQKKELKKAKILEKQMRLIAKWTKAQTEKNVDPNDEDSSAKPKK
ncbi:unnamed protein product [Xylocopa violacea]|uniref:Large ribosomal subunit protein mL64 n=1 Tax=Xylocopa violacea TaxID=135666 RepID=A0ABP1NRA0_XYLVO